MPSTGANEDRALMKAEDVADILKDVPVSTVYAWARQGFLPSLKIGRHRRFLREQIDDFIDRQAAA
jgi:excisionase family DNA binding protein